MLVAYKLQKNWLASADPFNSPVTDIVATAGAVASRCLPACRVFVARPGRMSRAATFLSRIYVPIQRPRVPFKRQPLFVSNRQLSAGLHEIH